MEIIDTTETINILLMKLQGIQPIQKYAVKLTKYTEQAIESNARNLDWDKKIHMNQCNTILSYYNTHYKAISSTLNDASPTPQDGHKQGGTAFFLLIDTTSCIIIERHYPYNMWMWSWTTPRNTKHKGVLMITAHITKN